MAESAARQRDAINLDEFERRLRLPASNSREQDALAELARIVGASNDPFKDLFAQVPAPEAAAPPAPQSAPALDEASGLLRETAGRMREPQGAFTPPPPVPAHFADPQEQFEREVYRNFDDARAEAPAVAPHVAAPPVAAAPQFATGLTSRRVAGARPPAVDQWDEAKPFVRQSYEDEGAAAGQMPPPPFIAANQPPPPSPRRPAASGSRFGSRKNVMLMGGALGVLVLGIGATLATKGSISTASKPAPTILAAKDPVKVKPESGATATTDNNGAAKPVRNISLLDRNGEQPKPARVVSREEQPVDLQQVPPAPRGAGRTADPDLDRKVNLGDSNVGRPIASVGGQARAPEGAGYFPEPRRVRTVMVRPDGTIINPPAAAGAPRVPVAMLATGSTGAPAVAAPRAPQPVTAAPDPDAPRATIRATPQRAAAPAAQAAPQRPAQPQRTAAVDPRPTPPRAAAAAPAGGGFAVQLAAPGSEAEARSVAARLRQRFSAELAGKSPSVVRAQVGERTVYRVRVTGLSREAATAMCSKMQSKGGACFVAR